MRLCVLTPRSPVVDAEVQDVYAPGTVGQLGVLPDHITFLCTLDPGELRYRTSGGAALLVISGGVLEVVSNEVTILADMAVAPQEIDVSAVREELAEAERALASLDPLSDAYVAAQANRKWALVRIAAAEQSGSAS